MAGGREGGMGGLCFFNFTSSLLGTGLVRCRPSQAGAVHKTTLWSRIQRNAASLSAGPGPPPARFCRMHFFFSSPLVSPGCQREGKGGKALPIPLRVSITSCACGGPPFNPQNIPPGVTFGRWRSEGERKAKLLPISLAEMGARHGGNWLCVVGDGDKVHDRTPGSKIW